MKVGIFLSTTGRGEKQGVMLDFAKGIEKHSKDRVLITSRDKYVDCDIALIFGYFGINRGVTQNFRKQIYDTHKARGKHCIFVEADPLKYAGKIIADTSASPVMYFKLPYKSVYYNKSEFFNKESKPDRWREICKRKRVEVLPYRESGDHILICMNRGIGDNSRSWSTKGVDINPWLFEKIKEIRSVTDRKIVVRFHPMFKKSSMSTKIPQKVLKSTNNISVSGLKGGNSLVDDCVNAHAAVVYNTSACVIPLIRGIPVFSDQDDCMAYPIANKNIKKFIESPKIIDREQWFYDLGYSLWCRKDMRDGTFWRRFKKFVK